MAPACVYFRFVTLAMVGHGDIVPLGRVAGMPSHTGAIAGRMCVAILVARRVGMQFARSGDQARYKRDIKEERPWIGIPRGDGHRRPDCSSRRFLPHVPRSGWIPASTRMPIFRGTEPTLGSTGRRPGMRRWTGASSSWSMPRCAPRVGAGLPKAGGMPLWTSRS
ncbi:protein of unknown function [Methylococcus capsulatus]|uniref:Potassium channel domain-containing protein n=1 Tax=Methylococcus capsulatus TaxID=414 RepID=A0AA35XUB7_METCP|nr:protein of unknown function [Methylococcus capsulatus]